MDSARVRTVFDCGHLSDHLPVKAEGISISTYEGKTELVIPIDCINCAAHRLRQNYTAIEKENGYDRKLSDLSKDIARCQQRCLATYPSHLNPMIKKKSLEKEYERVAAERIAARAVFRRRFEETWGKRED